MIERRPLVSKLTKMIHVRYPILNNEHEEMVFEFIMYYAVGINTTNDIEATSKGGAIIRATLIIKYSHYVIISQLC